MLVMVCQEGYLMALDPGVQRAAAEARLPQRRSCRPGRDWRYKIVTVA